MSLKRNVRCVGGFFNKLLVVDSSFTGKTIWQLYLLWRLSQLGVTVVAVWNRFDERMLFTRWASSLALLHWIQTLPMLMAVAHLRKEVNVEGLQKLLRMHGLPSTQCMCASSDGAYRGSRTAFQEELRDPNTWYLVDAQLPTLVPAITVQTSSPHHKKTYVSIYCPSLACTDCADIPCHLLVHLKE